LTNCGIPDAQPNGPLALRVTFADGMERSFDRHTVVVDDDNPVYAPRGTQDPRDLYGNVVACDADTGSTPGLV
jgi:hypothetical protein